MTKQKKRLPRWIALFLGGLIVAGGLAWYWQSQPGSGYTVEPGFAALEQAFQDQRSGFMTEVSGKVARILTADRGDTSSQEFVIRLENGQSILIVHDFRTGPVPVAIDDRVTVRGEYSWSETGGVIRHTQRDLSPQRRHGFVEHQGKRYQ